jgi:hypothetical protein
MYLKSAEIVTDGNGENAEKKRGKQGNAWAFISFTIVKPCVKMCALVLSASGSGRNRWFYIKVNGFISCACSSGDRATVSGTVWRGFESL